MSKYKFLIIGSARHGKDTFASILEKELGLKCKTSSLVASELFIFDALKDKYGYKTPEECFNDRFNHRKEWHELIKDYNKNDKTRLAKDILKTNDCYVGMRDKDEIKKCREEGLFDLIIWVDASERLPLEGSSSFNINKDCADIIISNNGSYDEFISRIYNFIRFLKTT